MATRKTVAKRQARLEDLHEIERMCREEWFDVGYHNAKLYFETSPDGWVVFVDEDGKIAGVQGTNLLSNGMQYGYITIVVDEFKGRGLGKQLMPDVSTGAFMCSSNQLTMLLPAMSANVWLEKRHGFYGCIHSSQRMHLRVPAVPGVELRVVDEDSVEALLDYDARVSLLDRREFVKSWSTPPVEPGNPEYGRSIVAVDEASGQCVGYGTLRLFSYYYGIQPLYADSDEIARALMTALVKWYLDKDKAYLYMPLMASKREALKFCYDLGMGITSSEVRNCSKHMIPYVNRLPIDNVYSVHEYYPV